MLTNGDTILIRCKNCNSLPKQHINKLTKEYSLKCPECKIKTGEYKEVKIAISNWNKIHV